MHLTVLIFSFAPMLIFLPLGGMFGAGLVALGLPHPQVRGLD